MQAYDLIVIGSGPGGQRAAIQAAKSGKRVVIIEKGAAVGGVCINTGTIPSKTMREAVLHLSGFYYQNFYGANYHVKDVVTMSDLNYRVHRGNETGGQCESSCERQNHHRQRSDSRYDATAEDADCGGRRCDRRGIRVHVRDTGRARDDCGEAAAAAGVCGHRNG